MKVRHVPILLEVEEKNGEEQEQEKETNEVKRGTMTAAPILLQTNGHQASQKNRPPRFSLPSPSVTESAKVHYVDLSSPPPYMGTNVTNAMTHLVSTHI